MTFIRFFLFLIVFSIAKSGFSQTTTQALDQDGLANIDILYVKDASAQGTISLEAWSLFQGQGTRNGVFPSNLIHGLEVYIDGKHWVSNEHLQSSFSYNLKSLGGYSSNTIPLPRNNAEIEMRLYGQVIGRYDIQDGKINETMRPRKLSRFHIRSFGNPKVISSNLVYGPESSKDLRSWIKKPVFIEEKSSAFSPVADLHTHLAGAVRTADLLRIAEELKLPYPVKNLQAMGLKFKNEKVFQQNGEDYIPFSRENISFTNFIDGHDYQWNSIYDYFEINPRATVPFSKMETIYKMRDALTKSAKAFPHLLDALAQDYARTGVKYAELSFYTIVRPEFLKIANDLIPKLEQKYGVELRFLVGMRRHNDQKYFDDDIRLASQAMKDSPYVVGVDFMGHETNATTDFSKTLLKVKNMKADFPEMAIRVHAGENANHPDNILNAIKLGATRIGHGIYGVTEEVVALAKKNNVIIEFNFNSNLALQNIQYVNQLREAALKYLRGGVRVTFGTDGHGIYNSSAQSELAVARAIGFTDTDLGLIKRSDEAYISTMKKDFTARKNLNISESAQIPADTRKDLFSKQMKFKKYQGSEASCLRLFSL